MKIDYNIEESSQTSLLVFWIEEFKSKKDYILALQLISVIAGDHSLDPEMEIEDLKEIINKVKNNKKDSFVFDIHESGIEVEV